MFDERAVLEYGGLLAAGYGLYQSKSIHDIELEKARQRHQEVIDLAKSQHETDMKTAKQTYLLELFNSLEQHFQQLNADLIASSRESERDMFDQRNQSFQTIILASSVMFSALASIIVDGNLPEDTGHLLLIGYALTCSLSFSFLFLSIVFCIELVIRTSSFMYKRGKLHTKTLRKAINDTKGMMRDLRGEGKNPNSPKEGSNSSLADVVSPVESTKDESASTNSKQQDTTDGLKPSFSINNLGESSNVQGFRRAISQMQPGEIEAEFDRHEIEIRGYLKKREILNDSAAITSYQDEKSGRKKPFKHFWEESCETWWVLAILLFYGGSLNMLLALMIYMWATFFIFYKSIIAAIIGVSVLGLVSIIGIGTVVVMRHVDRATHQREMELLLRGAQYQSQQQQEQEQLLDEGSRQDFTSSTAEETESERAGLRSRWGGIPFGKRRVTRSDSNGSLAGADADPLSAPLPERAYSPNKHARVLTTWPVSRTARKHSGASVQSAGSERSDHATSPLSYHFPHQQQQQQQQTPHSQGRPPTGRCPSSTSSNHNARADLYYSPSNPHGLATHMEDDLESGTARSHSSTPSVPSVPSVHRTPRLRSTGSGSGSPRITAAHLYQEEPSPRRRFLSSFGRSSSKPTPNATQSSLYESSLCRTPADSHATPLATNARFMGTPVVGTPAAGAVVGQQTPHTQAQRAFAYLTPQGLTPHNNHNNHSNSIRAPHNTPMSGLDVNYESSSDLSGTMGGGITF